MPSGFYNGTTMFADNVSFDGTETPGKVTANGQLLIGSSVAPNIRVGTLTSADSSVTITNGNGTIDLSVPASDSGIQTINGDTGSITGSTVTIFANNATNNSGSSIKFVNSGTVSTLNVTDAFENTLIGLGAGNLTLTGIANTGLGENVLQSITNGLQNTAIGQDAAFSMTTGSGNVSLGHFSHKDMITGANNVAVGEASMQQANTCVDCIGIGTEALFVATGSNNIGIGYRSGYSMTSGTFNVGIGWGSLSGSTIGTGNVCLGQEAGNGINGANNISIGFQSMFGSSTTSNSICIGFETGRSLSSGTGNVAMGILSMNSLSSGSENTILGNQSGQSYTSSESNNILLGNGVSGVVGENQTIRIGSTQTRAFCAGITGVTVASSAPAAINSLGQISSLGLGTSGEVLTSNGASSPTWQAVGGGILTATVTLTSLQIKSLNATPIDIIPAPGAGNTIVVISTNARFVYGGTNVFVAAANQTISLYFRTLLPNTIVNGIVQASVLTGTTTRYSQTPPNSYANIDPRNLALVAHNPVATEISGNASNNNTVVIQVRYYITNI